MSSQLNTHTNKREDQKTVLVPLLPNSDSADMVKIAQNLAHSRRVIVVGLVPVASGQSLSTGAQKARQLRGVIEKLSGDRVNILPGIRVSDAPWDDIRQIIVEEQVELLMLYHPNDLNALELNASEILSHPPCDVGLVRGPIPQKFSKVIVPINGGPHSECSLDLGLALSQPDQGKVTSLRLDSVEKETAQSNREFEPVISMLEQMPEVEQARASQNNQAEAIIESAIDNDLIILGTVQRPTVATDSFGAIPDFILANAKCGVIAIKTRRLELDDQKPTAQVSKKVDRWFAQNTFHADEFDQLEQLVAAKQAKGLRISLALPTLNEEETLSQILAQTQDLLMEQYPLIDELVVIDSGSTDDTREIARSFGVPVYIHQELLPRYGMRDGKGEALWKSLYVTTGDIVLWCDTDIKNFHPRFIYGLAGPLIRYPNIQFVKGFYKRPLNMGKNLTSGGGRVTELTARPLLNMFYPQLAGIIQPLAGEYGGRRDLLEKLAFTSGYGVETSLLIDSFEKAGLDALAQVDLIERIHQGQSLEDLSRMAFAVSQTIFSRLNKKELKAVSHSMRRLEQEFDEISLVTDELIEADRPPMRTVPEYRDRYRVPERPLTGVKKENLLRGTLDDPEDVFLVPGTFTSKS